MDLEDLLEAAVAGEDPQVPDELRETFGRAMAAHEALRGTGRLRGPWKFRAPPFVRRF